MKEHPKKKHEVKVSKRPKNLYCPFNCHFGPYHTLTDQLAHSHSQHDSDLSKTTQQSKSLHGEMLPMGKCYSHRCRCIERK